VRQWIWKQIVASGYDVSAAINRGLDDMDGLDETEHRMVDRAGLTKLIGAEMRRAKLLIEKNGGPAEQMPLFASVPGTDGRLMRVNYLHLSLPQLTTLFERERKSARRLSDRTARLRHDLALFRRHKDLPNVQAVWDMEHVEYRLDEAA
jgi:hypothetical protein